jgi:uncharacterized protein (DUF1778 family)
MARRPKQSTWISVQLSQSEKQILDDAAKAAGQTRNRFIRLWIASLLRRQSPSG